MESNQLNDNERSYQTLVNPNNSATQKTFSSNMPVKKSNIPFARYLVGSNKKIALLYIFIPLIIFAIIQKGPLFIFAFLLYPMFMLSISYGVVLFFKKDKIQIEKNFDSSFLPSYKKNKSYKRTLVQFAIGISLLIFAAFLIFMVNKSAGYAGSEAGVIAFPFIICGLIFILFSIGNFLVTYFSKSNNR